MARAPLTPPLNMVALPQGPISLVVVTETTRPVAPSLLGGRDLTVHTVALAPFRAVAALLTAIDPDLVVLETAPGPSWEAVEDVLAVARVGVVLVADVEPAQALALVDRGVDDVIGQAGLEADALEAVVRRAVARRRRLLPPGVSLATVEEGHLEQFVSACPTPLALVDAGDTLVTLNAAARALLGCRAAGEAECQSLSALLHGQASPDGEAISPQTHGRLVARATQREVAVIRQRLRRNRVLLAFADLGALAQDAPSSLGGDELFRALAVSSPAAVLIAREDQVVFANPAACELAGATAGDLGHQTLRALGAAALGASGRGKVDVRLPLGGGREHWVQLTAIPIQHGGHGSVLVSAVDQSERHRLEEQELVGGRLDAIGRLAGGIAHDFNNLLQVVDGHLERLRDDLPAVDPLRPSVEAIGAAAARAASLTEQLLAVGRRQVLLPQSVDLNELVTRFVAEHSASLPVSVRVNLAMDPHLPPVRIDATRLSQALAQLIMNACEAMPKGGDLTLATRLVQVTEGGRLAMSDAATMAAGTYVSLDVSDTGRGMTPDIMAQAFEPFFTTKQHAPGAGLGLSTVYGIIKQSGGYVDGNSVPNRGTTWSLWLPSAGEPASTSPRVAPARTRVRVLLVEDEEAVRTMLTEWLERDGLEVHAVGAAPDALEVQARSAIDVLVTDVGLPVVSGPALARAMVQRVPGLPVIFISGFVADAVDRREFDANAVFLQKPFSPRELARRIREAAAAVATRA